MTMGAKIKQLRSKKGLSQEKLAEKLNVSRSAVAKWEADGGIPEIDNLLQLSLAFGISIDELVGNANGQNNSNEAKTVNSEAHDFGNQCYDIELAGWNDGVYSVYIIAEDTDFLYYYQYSDKVNSILWNDRQKIYYICLASQWEENGEAIYKGNQQRFFLRQIS